jgi:hypothetical protein
MLYARSATEAANLLDSYYFDAVLVIDPIQHPSVGAAPDSAGVN